MKCFSSFECVYQGKSVSVFTAEFFHFMNYLTKHINFKLGTVWQLASLSHLELPYCWVSIFPSSPTGHSLTLSLQHLPFFTYHFIILLSICLTFFTNRKRLNLHFSELPVGRMTPCVQYKWSWALPPMNFCKIHQLGNHGNSLAVQWLGLCTFTSRGVGLIPGGGTRIPHAVECSQKKRIKRKPIFGIWYVYTRFFLV